MGNIRIEVIGGGANDDITFRITKWDDSASTFVTLIDYTRTINNVVGGMDVAYFVINTRIQLDQNDYIKPQVANITNTSNVVGLNNSYIIIDEI